MIIPVVIVQTSTSAYMACKRDLPSAGYVDSRDYILDDEADNITSKAIIPGARQLLVIGSIGGNNDAADKFAEQMKQKNPNLRVAWFSTHSREIRPPYDICIPKVMGITPKLIDSMREFLSQ